MSAAGGGRVGGGWWRYVVVGGAGVLLGISGGAALSDPTSTDEYAAVEQERDQLEARGEALARNAEDARRLTQEAEARASQAESAAYQAQVDLEQREADLVERETGLVEREVAVTATEEEAASSQIQGNGFYVVGEDVQPGEYRTEGGSPCYYAFKDGTGSDADIIDNELFQGPGRVTLEDGDIFETSRCGTWTPVGS